MLQSSRQRTARFEWLRQDVGKLFTRQKPTTQGRQLGRQSIAHAVLEAAHTTTCQFQRLHQSSTSVQVFDAMLEPAKNSADGTGPPESLVSSHHPSGTCRGEGRFPELDGLPISGLPGKTTAPERATGLRVVTACSSLRTPQVTVAHRLTGVSTSLA